MEKRTDFEDFQSPEVREEKVKLVDSCVIVFGVVKHIGR
jgi:hypothetical protein